MIKKVFLIVIFLRTIFCLRIENLRVEAFQISNEKACGDDGVSSCEDVIMNNQDITLSA